MPPPPRARLHISARAYHHHPALVPRIDADSLIDPPPAQVVQVGLAEDVYAALVEAAGKAGTTPEAIATDAIRKHLNL